MGVKDAGGSQKRTGTSTRSYLISGRHSGHCVVLLHPMHENRQVMSIAPPSTIAMMVAKGSSSS